MTAGSEDKKYWGLRVWIRSRIKKDAQGCRDPCLRKDCVYQWAILVPTYPAFSLRHLEAELRNKRHPNPLPCLSSLSLSLALDQQKPCVKLSHHPFLLSQSCAVEVAHQAMQRNSNSWSSKFSVLPIPCKRNV